MAEEPQEAPRKGVVEEGATGDDEPTNASLQTVVRGGTTGARPVLDEAQSIGVLTQQELKRSDGLFLEESINLLPGVRLENRTLSGGQRITIRGYGNGTNFNGMGYRAYLDGIPLTDAEGTTMLDDVDVSTLGRVEVIRGPASSLYGAGIGGVVKMSTLRPRRDSTRLSQEVLGGSFGLLRTNTRIEHGTHDAAFLLNYGHQQVDGYRIHSGAKKDFVLFSGNFQASERQSLSVIASFNRSNEQLAGQLTEDQFLNEENVAEAPYLANDAHVKLGSFRLGLSQRYDALSWLTNTSSVYASGYQLGQPFAAGRNDNLALNLGARTEFTLHLAPGGLPIEGTLGAEVQQTNGFKKGYGLTDGILGGIRTDLQVTSLQASPVFTQWEVQLPDEWEVTAGASVNLVRYHIRDRLTNSANPKHADQSGVKEFAPVLTPRVALLKRFAQDLEVYAQVSQGYTPPTSSNVVIPQAGMVNLDLRPERGMLFEVGSKGLLQDGRFSYEAALFDMFVTDKLTPQAVTGPTGTVLYSISTNAGGQENRGLELATKYALIRDEGGIITRLQPFATYTLSHFRYAGFKSDNNNDARTVDYTGKRVVGVPTHVVNAGVDVMSRFGVYLNATYQYVDSVPLTFDNAHTAAGYALLSSKLGYRMDLPAHFRLDASVGSNNMLGSRYYTMAFLNANYAGAAPNVFLPGPYTPTFYGGVTLSYTPEAP